LTGERDDAEDDDTDYEMIGIHINGAFMMSAVVLKVMNIWWRPWYDALPPQAAGHALAVLVLGYIAAMALVCAFIVWMDGLS
jgi:hypothetical protein